MDCVAERCCYSAGCLAGCLLQCRVAVMYSYEGNASLLHRPPWLGARPFHLLRFFKFEAVLKCKFLNSKSKNYLPVLPLPYI
jgi:hypothetical protein